MIDSLPNAKDLGAWNPDLTKADDLHPLRCKEPTRPLLTIEGCHRSYRRWDTLVISSVTETDV